MRDFLTSVRICVLAAAVSIAWGCSKTEPQPLPPVKPAADAGKATQQGALPPVDLKVSLPVELSALKAETEKAKAQVDLVITSLESTVAAADADPRPAFQKFQKDFEALKAQGDTVRARADAMKAKGRDYFKAWEAGLAAIATPEIKKAAEARRDDLAKSFDGIIATMGQVREGYDKYISFMTDIEKVMENDLNAQGLKTMASKLDAVKEGAGTVKTNADAVLAELGKIAAIYSPGK